MRSVTLSFQVINEMHLTNKCIMKNKGSETSFRLPNMFRSFVY